MPNSTIFSATTATTAEALDTRPLWLAEATDSGLATTQGLTYLAPGPSPAAALNDLIYVVGTVTIDGISHTDITLRANKTTAGGVAADWSVVPGGGGDDLGSHVMTQDLITAGFEVKTNDNAGQDLTVRTAREGTNGSSGEMVVASGEIAGNGGVAGGLILHGGDHSAANAAQTPTGTQNTTVLRGSDGLNATTARDGGDVTIRGGNVINPAHRGGHVDISVGESPGGTAGSMRVRTPGVVAGTAGVGSNLQLAAADGTVEFVGVAVDEFNSASANPTSTDATLTFAAGDLNLNDPLNIEAWFSSQTVDATSIGGSATQDAVQITSGYTLLILTGPAAITDEPFIIWFSGLANGDTIEPISGAFNNVQVEGAGTIAAGVITADGTGIVGFRASGADGINLSLSGGTMHMFGEIPAPAAAGNLYDADGALTGPRSVSLDGNDLTLVASDTLDNTILRDSGIHQARAWTNDLALAATYVTGTTVTPNAEDGYSQEIRVDATSTGNVAVEVWDNMLQGNIVTLVVDNNDTIDRTFDFTANYRKTDGSPLGSITVPAGEERAWSFNRDGASTPTMYLLGDGDAGTITPTAQGFALYTLIADVDPSVTAGTFPIHNWQRTGDADTTGITENSGFGIESWTLGEGRWRLTAQIAGNQTGGDFSLRAQWREVGGALLGARSFQLESGQVNDRSPTDTAAAYVVVGAGSTRQVEITSDGGTGDDVFADGTWVTIEQMSPLTAVDPTSLTPTDLASFHFSGFANQESVAPGTDITLEGEFNERGGITRLGNVITLPQSTIPYNVEAFLEFDQDGNPTDTEVMEIAWVDSVTNTGNPAVLVSQTARQSSDGADANPDFSQNRCYALVYATGGPVSLKMRNIGTGGTDYDVSRLAGRAWQDPVASVASYNPGEVEARAFTSTTVNILDTGTVSNAVDEVFEDFPTPISMNLPAAGRYELTYSVLLTPFGAGEGHHLRFADGGGNEIAPSAMFINSGSPGNTKLCTRTVEYVAAAAETVSLQFDSAGSGIRILGSDVDEGISSFISYRQLPTTEVVAPGSVTPVDVETVEYAKQTGLVANTTYSLDNGRTWQDLKNDYQYLHLNFEMDVTGVPDAVLRTVVVKTVDIVDASHTRFEYGSAVADFSFGPLNTGDFSFPGAAVLDFIGVEVVGVRAQQQILPTNAEPLPTADGDYRLNITSGTVTWNPVQPLQVLEGTGVRNITGFAIGPGFVWTDLLNAGRTWQDLAADYDMVRILARIEATNNGNDHFHTMGEVWADHFLSAATPEFLVYRMLDANTDNGGSPFQFGLNILDTQRATRNLTISNISGWAGDIELHVIGVRLG